MRGKESLPISHDFRKLDSSFTVKDAPIPLPFVPLPAERNGFIRAELKNTAGHELNHALLAKSCRISVESISVRPSGDSLGRTTFAGHISPEMFKVIAAGGTISLPDSQARGYGMDIYMINVMELAYGGASEKSAKSEAYVLLAGYDPRVRVKAAEILAWLGEVSGQMLDAILERSRFEIELESGGKIAWLKNDFSQKPQNVENDGKSTIIEYLGEEKYRIIYLQNGRKEKEFFWQNSGGN